MPLAPTRAHLEAVLTTAGNLLGARRGSMDTVDEWAALARAVAACTGRSAVEYLSPRDVQHVREYWAAWDDAADGTLPEGEG